MARDFDWNKALNGELGEDAQRNTEWLQSIAERCDAIARGEVYVDEDGDLKTAPEGIPEGCEQASMYDYLDENYGVKFVVDTDMEIRGCIITVAFGGPNVYIDTYEQLVEMYWGLSYACYPLTYKAIDAINDWAQEYFDIIKWG